MNAIREIQQMLGLVQHSDGKSVALTSRDAIFVCIDLEAFEFAHEKITEIGVAVLDSRDLTGVPTEDWLSKLNYAFYRIAEYRHLRNKRFVKGCPDDFNFGPCTWIALKDAKKVLTRIFSDPNKLSHAADFDQEIAYAGRNVIFVAHNASSDEAFLGKLGFSLTKDSNIARTVDTQLVAGGSKKKNIALHRLLLSLGINAENLHNGGNDAAYTLQAMVTMATAEDTQPGCVVRGLSRLQGKLPPAIYIKRPAPQIWMGTSVPFPKQKQAIKQAGAQKVVPIMTPDERATQTAANETTRRQRKNSRRAKRQAAGAAVVGKEETAETWQQPLPFFTSQASDQKTSASNGLAGSKRQRKMRRRNENLSSLPSREQPRRVM